MLDDLDAGIGLSCRRVADAGERFRRGQARGEDGTRPLQRLAVGPCSTMRPCARTMTRSASVRASSTSWVTMIAVGPAARAQGLRRRPGHRDVERRERFVEQQQLRVGRERSGDRDALRLPAGELGRAGGANSTASTSPSQCWAVLVRLGSRMPGCARAERDVVEHAEVREQQRLLGEQCDTPGVRRSPSAARRRRGRTAVPVRASARARVRPHEPGEHAEQRRLAGAVGAEDRDGLAGLDAQSTSKSRSCDRGRRTERHGAASAQRRAGCPRRWASPTTTTATTTSTSDSATAASGSISRCR